MNNQNINPKSLKGKDVFNRALDLMNKLTPINESVINASLEFVKRGPNGLVYTIIRENHKYFIKTTEKTEFKVSDLDYIGGLKNKMTEAYPSYEEALKHLNMKFHELNETYGIKRGYNLFEQDAFSAEDSSNEETGVKEKKYKLKVKPSEEESSDKSPMGFDSEPTGPEMTMEKPSIEDVPAGPTAEEAPTSEEGPTAEEAPTSEEGPTAEEAPTSEEGPSDEEGPEMGDMSSEEDEDDLDIEDDEEDPKKYIQKLTGRLGQKLRELPEVDPKLEKYVINSIISALHVDKMDKKDRMDVIRKFKKKKGMESMMKESYGLDELYGLMSMDGPYNYEKIKGGFDESDDINSKKESPLKFKKYDLDMDEELHGDQHKLDLNKNGRLDKEDFKMLRTKKKKKSSDEGWQDVALNVAANYAIPKAIDYIGDKISGSDENLQNKKISKKEELKAAFRNARKYKESSDEQWGALARVAIPAVASYVGSKLGDSDESLDRKNRIKDALDRIKMKRKKSMEDDEIKFHSSKDEKYSHDMDEMDISELYDTNYGLGNHDDPETTEPYTKPVVEPGPDVDKPLTPPTPRRQNPFNPPIPDQYPQPKAKIKK